MAKTLCPLSQSQFLSAAKPIVVDLLGNKVVFEPRVFSSGSFGWGFSDKISVDLGGERIKVQCSLNLPVIGSKDVE